MIVKSNCRICACNCGVELNIENNKITNIKGDKDSFSKGFICKKSLSHIENLSASRTFTSPLIRNSDGILEESSWEAALDYISKKMSSIIEKSGSKSIAFHSGENYDNSDISDMAKVFLNSIGSPNFSDSGSYCNLARDIANRINHGFGSPKPDFKNSESIVLWGSNPMSSTPRFAQDIDIARKNGAKLVVIDPVKNKLGENADLYLQIRPGSDGMLALGILNILFERNAIDEELWNNTSIGFKEFKEYVKGFNSIEVETSTWIESSDLEKLADIYQNSKSLTSSIGVAIELQTNAVQSIRSIVSLDMLAGFYNKKGCSLTYPDSNLNSIKIDSKDKPIGYEEFPLLSDIYGLAQINRLTKSVLEKDPYKIDALILYNSNSALSLPNTNKVIEALKQLELLVVIDSKVNETAEYADVVLPMTNTYERISLRKTELDDGVYMIYSDKVIEPDIVAEIDFFIELSKKLGSSNKMRFHSQKDIINYRLKGIGSNIDELMNNKSKMIKISNYSLSDLYNTESSKAEFHSNLLYRYGYNPLPEYTEPVESMITNTYNPEFIFTATTGTRVGGAEISNNKSKKKGAQAHKAVLKKFHAHDGDLVTIASKRGSIEMIVHESDRICPNTISIPQSTKDQNPNVLVDNEELDPIIGYPGCRSFLIKFNHSH